jgi:plasmid stabilization system protein ParE
VKYEVVVQPAAASEIEAAFLYLVEAASVNTAVEWFQGLENAMVSLGRFPKRCAKAPEDAFFGEEVRQLLLEPYRILFTIRPGTVDILHVRHMARRHLGEIIEEGE